ncbi:hypothetical protein MTR_2025s0010 [Medicago truncatula]|uniref:Uncharacterized protein n=1 Tax=Medicago truncatula TaxID=3880 RepID=A0A072TD18_MEDTR|nr:hypothetical protein MTR_2025s0010 [Medicago truncatula]
MLRRGVSAVERHLDQSRDRRHPDDPAMPARDHPAREALRDLQRRKDIRFEHRTKHGDRDLHERAGLHDRRVVQQDIDLVRQCVRTIDFVRHIELDDLHVHAARLGLLTQCPDLRPDLAARDDAMPPLRQCERDPSPESGPRTGYQHRSGHASSRSVHDDGAARPDAPPGRRSCRLRYGVSRSQRPPRMGRRTASTTRFGSGRMPSVAATPDSGERLMTRPLRGTDTPFAVAMRAASTANGTDRKARNRASPSLDDWSTQPYDPRHGPTAMSALAFMRCLAQPGASPQVMPCDVARERPRYRRLVYFVRASCRRGTSSRASRPSRE